MSDTFQKNDMEIDALPIAALVLDDDDFDRRRLCRMGVASGLDMNIVSVSTISKMVACLDVEAFDLIFLDYRLANETGLDALELIQDHKNSVGATKIMLTGHLKVDVAVAALKNGCHDYISKDTLNPSMLRQVVEMGINRSQSNRQAMLTREEMIDKAVFTMAAQHLPHLLASALSSSTVLDVIAPLMRSTIREELSLSLEDIAERHRLSVNDELRHLIVSLGDEQQITWSE